MDTSQEQHKNSVTNLPKTGPKPAQNRTETGQEPAKNRLTDSPRTAQEQPKNSTMEAPETVSMTFRMSAPLHTRARVHVAHTKIPLSALLRDLLTAHLDAQENPDTDA